MEIPYLQQNLIVSRVQECIGTRLNRELSLSTSTEESGYSREYFLLMFRAATGINPTSTCWSVGLPALSSS
jgi:AraC-like DNA-binding protein